MPEVPQPADVGQDFRTLPAEGNPSNVLLATLPRDVKARHSLVRDTLEDDNLAKEALMGSQAGTRDSDALATALIEATRFNRQQFRASGSADDAFTYLRSLAEAKGVFVLLAGDCGHLSPEIEVKLFRGFAIANDLAAFIGVNDQDAMSA